MSIQECNTPFLIHKSTFIVRNYSALTDIYEVTEILGSGTYGEVRLAKHK